MRRNSYGLFFILVVILSCTLLNACGFHLRGSNYSNYKFPFRKVYLECGNVIICQNLKTAIITESLAQLESAPNTPKTITIKLSNEQTSRDPQGFNSVGRISAYIFTYQAVAQLWQKGEQIGNDINVSQHLIMQYNDGTILADTTEEQNFWEQLHEMATNQLIHRIIYFKPFQTYSHATESK